MFASQFLYDSYQFLAINWQYIFGAHIFCPNVGTLNSISLSHELSTHLRMRICRLYALCTLFRNILCIILWKWIPKESSNSETTLRKLMLLHHNIIQPLRLVLNSKKDNHDRFEFCSQSIIFGNLIWEETWIWHILCIDISLDIPWTSPCYGLV